MLTEGLAITRALHDRYHPSRRNPWNEVECGDHYARSMASYGVYLAACGFEYHGPKGHIAFAPRLTPDNFRAPFTAAEGWGTFAVNAERGGRNAELQVKWGKLRVRTVVLVLPENAKAKEVRVTVNGNIVPAKDAQRDRRLTITLSNEALLEANEKLVVVVQ
jgi:non-lysosomal glucosylceramidase